MNIKYLLIFRLSILFSCGGVCCSGDDGDDGDCIHVLVHGFQQEDLTQRAQIQPHSQVLNFIHLLTVQIVKVRFQPAHNCSNKR